MIKNKKTKLQTIYILFMFLLVFNTISTEAGEAGDKIIISISAQEETAGPEILLGDIATIEEASSFQKKTLKKISICDAPRPGYHRTINRQKIDKRLEEEGFKSKDYMIKMPSVISVKTRSIFLTADHIMAYIENYIKKELPYHEEKIKIRIRNCPEKVEIPDSMYELEVAEKDSDKLLGFVSLPVLIKCNQEVWKKIYIGLEVKVIQEVFVAQKSYMYGQKPERDDFKREIKELGRIRGDLLLDWDNPLIKNGVIRVPFGRGTVLTNHYLKERDREDSAVEEENNFEELKIDNVEDKENDNNDVESKTVKFDDNKDQKKKDPYIINWGDKVQVEVVAGKVTVSVVVKAKERGKKGEYISVENIKTGYKFRAKVINDHLLRVEL